MGCNTCREKALQRERERLAAMGRSQARTGVPGSGSARKAVDYTKGCNAQYPSLRDLEKRIVEVYNVVKGFGDIGYKFLMHQRKVRQWIVDLPKRCPDEKELADLTEEVNHEYAERIKR